MLVSRRTVLAGGLSIAGEGLSGSHLSFAQSTESAGTLFVCGLNCSGMEDMPPGPPTLAMLQYYARKGIRYLRLPGLWEHFQEAGIRMICEPCHNFGHYKEKEQIYRLGDSQLTPGIFAQFWKKFCQIFGDMPCIAGWELMNEPHDLAGQGEAWQEAAQAAIAAIRHAGDVRPIWVEGYGYSSSAMWPHLNPTLHLLNDPARNLIFSAHCYLDRDNSGTHYYWDEETRAGDQIFGAPFDRNIGIMRIKPFVDWLRSHSLRGNIGECGVGRQDAPGKPGNAGWLGALDVTMRFCQDQDIPFYYWGTGKDFGSAYPYGLEPDAEAEAPQWNVLRRYL